MVLFSGLVPISFYRNIWENTFKKEPSRDLQDLRMSLNTPQKLRQYVSNYINKPVKILTLVYLILHFSRTNSSCITWDSELKNNSYPNSSEQYTSITESEKTVIVVQFLKTHLQPNVALYTILLSYTNLNKVKQFYNRIN